MQLLKLYFFLPGQGIMLHGCGTAGAKGKESILSIKIMIF
jgi:hypothetical protein